MEKFNLSVPFSLSHLKKRKKNGKKHIRIEGMRYFLATREAVLKLRAGNCQPFLLFNIRGGTFRDFARQF